MRTGDLYRHYKGGIYSIVCVSKLEGDPVVEMVAYMDESNECWTRPLAEFLGGVVHQGNYIRRFASLR